MVETMNQKESVTLGISNEGEREFSVEVIKNWLPEKVSYFGNVVYFKFKDKFYSIKSEDFKEIFEN